MLSYNLNCYFNVSSNLCKENKAVKYKKYLLCLCEAKNWGWGEGQALGTMSGSTPPHPSSPLDFFRWCMASLLKELTHTSLLGMSAFPHHHRYVR
jgi:hypothetical protein